MYRAAVASLAACAFRSAFVPPECACPAPASGACSETFPFGPDDPAQIRVPLRNQTLFVRTTPPCPSLRVTIEGQDAIEDLGYYGGDCWIAVDTASNTTAVVDVSGAISGTASIFVSPGPLPIAPSPISGRSGVTITTMVYFITPLNVSANAVSATAGASLTMSTVVAGFFWNVSSESTPYDTGLKAYAEGAWQGAKVFPSATSSTAAGVFLRGQPPATTALVGIPDAVVQTPQAAVMFEMHNSGNAPGDLLAGVSRTVLALKEHDALFWFASEPLSVIVDDPNARWWWIGVGSFFLTAAAVAVSFYPLFSNGLAWMRDKIRGAPQTTLLTPKPPGSVPNASQPTPSASQNEYQNPAYMIPSYTAPMDFAPPPDMSGFMGAPFLKYRRV